ncbi:hypothetical protein [Streptomyces melanogenes]|uniref:hypothetical protein n=1 Tax=Streptomyces melanogenes TaxID=67326 RepID=UPI00167CA0DF|nr:hypothetical protein [Streptomyces melanogenes]GGP59359.1 hypothetical protein GCM10010278_40570 [Streptomyces melanogenes]
MSRKLRRGILVCAAATTAVLGVGFPAYADGPTVSAPSVEQVTNPGTEPGPNDQLPITESEPEVVNTVPPAEPEETDLVENPTPEPLPETNDESPAMNGGVYCGPGTTSVYIPKTKGAQYHYGVGPTNSNYNGTSRTARSTFTSEVTGEVGVSVSAGLKTTVGFLVAKTEVQWNLSLSTKITAKLGNQISVDTPPHKTTNAKYGVYRLKTTGVSYLMYSNCKTSARTTVTSYIPLRRGWYLWEN